MQVLKFSISLLTIWLCSCAPKTDATTPRYGESRPNEASSAASAVAKDIEVNSTGEPYALHVTSTALSFCDDRGIHAVDLKTGLESPSTQGCPKKEEANTSCSGLHLDIGVRSNPADGVDIVDYGGRSYSLKGHVQDCMADGKRLAIATNANVVAIEPNAANPFELRMQGADRIAAASGWVVFAAGHRVFATRKP